MLDHAGLKSLRSCRLPGRGYGWLSTRQDAPLKARYRRDAIGVHFAALVDRHIFADHEMFVGEMVADILGQLGFAVIVKSPGTAGVVDEMTKFVLLRSGAPRDPAGLAMRPP